MENVIKVFIGFDPSETIAWHVLAHSVYERASRPVEIVPLRLQNLRRIHTRERHPLQSTEFSFTRFLVPYLCNYTGQAIYLDCDMLMLGDVAEMLEAADPLAPVSCVHHDHVPESDTKMLGQTQTRYACKNWSSAMVFNNWGCIHLTPRYVDDAPGLDLHQFKWTEGRPVGELPHCWNHLVGYDPDKPDYEIKNLHWTEGGPWWRKYRDAPFAGQWFREKDCLMDAWERLRSVA